MVITEDYSSSVIIPQMYIYAALDISLRCKKLGRVLGWEPITRIRSGAVCMREGHLGLKFLNITVK